MERLHELQGHPAVGGELLVGAVQALGCLHHRRVQEHQREGSPVDQRQDRLNREPRRRPRMQQPAAADLRSSQARFLTRQGAKVDQLAHEVLGDVRALGDLSDPVGHQDAASSHPLFIVAQPDAATARLAAAQGSSRGWRSDGNGRCCPSQEAAVPIGAVRDGVVVRRAGLVPTVALACSSTVALPHGRPRAKAHTFPVVE